MGTVVGAVVVGGKVVVGGAVVVGGWVVAGAAVVAAAVAGGVVATEGAPALLHNGVLQQLNEHDCIPPLREVFTISHPWFPLQRNSGKHPFELMNSFRTPSKA